MSNTGTDKAVVSAQQTFAQRMSEGSNDGPSDIIKIARTERAVSTPGPVSVLPKLLLSQRRSQAPETSEVRAQEQVRAWTAMAGV